MTRPPRFPGMAENGRTGGDGGDAPARFGNGREVLMGRLTSIRVLRRRRRHWPYVAVFLDALSVQASCWIELFARRFAPFRKVGPRTTWRKESRGIRA